MTDVLVVKDLYFKYEDNYVLEGISLRVKQGSFVAIIGENGSGKSTLLNLILRNLIANKGEIYLFNDLIQQNNHYQDIAFISQNAVMNYKHFPTTVKEVIKNHLAFLKKPLNIDYYLELIDLKNHADKSLSQLSGGQLQRVGLVLALIKDAKLILLDEPTTGIDKRFTHQLFSLLKSLKKQDKTVVMITHDLEEAQQYCDQIIHIKNGKNHHCQAREWEDLVRM